MTVDPNTLEMAVLSLSFAVTSLTQTITDLLRELNELKAKQTVDQLVSGARS